MNVLRYKFHAVCVTGLPREWSRQSLLSTKEEEQLLDVLAKRINQRAGASQTSDSIISCAASQHVWHIVANTPLYRPLQLSFIPMPMSSPAEMASMIAADPTLCIRISQSVYSRQ
jgi:hypothetical protein